jgi:hypothetical protein
MAFKASCAVGGTVSSASLRNFYAGREGQQPRLGRRVGDGRDGLNRLTAFEFSDFPRLEFWIRQQ